MNSWIARIVASYCYELLTVLFGFRLKTLPYCIENRFRGFFGPIKKFNLIEFDRYAYRNDIGWKKL